jgi:hypothetical protein
MSPTAFFLMNALFVALPRRGFGRWSDSVGSNSIAS